VTAAIAIRAATRADARAWLALRASLWGDEGGPEDAAGLEPFFAGGDHAAFVAAAGDGVIGLAEAGLRHDYVNGTRSSPVAFLEAWAVDPAHRGQGIGRRLVQAVEAWARECGCTEVASDARLDNVRSHGAHAACGFRETERVVYFAKALA
jgi:aminoglycoside 6'-N-acetyltransferase I